MKGIALLNKMANGEEVPKKIKYRNKIFDYEDADYFNTDMGYLFDRYSALVILNDELEIIEEEKKIPEPIKTKIGYGGLTYLEDENFSDGINGFNHREDVIVSKINEIIDYLKSKGE